MSNGSLARTGPRPKYQHSLSTRAKRAEAAARAAAKAADAARLRADKVREHRQRFEEAMRDLKQQLRRERGKVEDRDETIASMRRAALTLEAALAAEQQDHRETRAELTRLRTALSALAGVA